MYRNILSDKQIELLPLIKNFRSEFYLVGGTAVALHVGHRRSIDFDLFKKSSLNSKRIKEKLNKSTFRKIIIHEETDQLHLKIHDVKITFFTFGFEIPHQEKFENIISLPSLLDLAAMKAFALGGRAKWKDYIDLYFLFKYYFNLNDISARAEELFSEMFSAKLFRQQICFFSDIDYEEKVEFMEGFQVSEDEVKNYLIDIATALF